MRGRVSHKHVVAPRLHVSIAQQSALKPSIIAHSHLESILLSTRPPRPRKHNTLMYTYYSTATTHFSQHRCFFATCNRVGMYVNLVRAYRGHSIRPRLAQAHEHTHKHAHARARQCAHAHNLRVSRRVHPGGGAGARRRRCGMFALEARPDRHVFGWPDLRLHAQALASRSGKASALSSSLLARSVSYLAAGDWLARVKLGQSSGGTLISMFRAIVFRACGAQRVLRFEPS